MTMHKQISAIKFYAGIGLLFLMVVFAAQNAEVVTINFLFWEFSLSRAVLIFLLLAIGFIIGRIYTSLKHSRRPRPSD